MPVPQSFELANDSEFRLLANFSTPPRAGRITTIEPSGQVRVATDDPDGGDVLAWPLNGFTYAVNDVVYVAFAANSPDTAIVIGSKAPLPALDAGALPEAYVPVDGSDPLTADWDIGEDRRIKAEGIRARDGEGLKLEDDAGNVGVFVEDGGLTGIGGVTNPTAPLQVGGDNSGVQAVIYPTGAFSSIRAMVRAIPKGTPTSSNGRAVMQFFNTDFVADPANYEYAQFGMIADTFEVLSRGVGTGTTRPINLWTYNNAHQLYLAANGNIGSGTASPQGRFHVHDGTGGLIFVTKTGITNVAQTLIPNAAGDVTGGLGGFFVANDGLGAVANAFTMLPGDNLDIVIGGYTLRLALNANGALTAVRQAGTGTATLVMLAVWL